MIDKGLKYEDQRLTEKQKKKIKPVNQGGGPNYLGKQETVTVPKKWLSDPDHVVAELAYITPREKKVLIDLNMYGSLKGKPNKGPGGIQSLQGDMGSVGGGNNDNDGGGNDEGQGRKDAESQYGDFYDVGYKSEDNRSGREQVYGAGAGAETTPITEVDLLESFKPKEVGGLFSTPPRNIQQAFNIISTPRTVANVRNPNPNPFTGLTKDVLNPDDDTQVDSLTEGDDEGIMAFAKEIFDKTLLGQGLNYLKKQAAKQEAKQLFANTMDPSPPPVDTIASLTAGLGGGGQGMDSFRQIYMGPPALRAIEPVSPIVEEEVVDPRTAEMEAFREILRRNLGLI